MNAAPSDGAKGRVAALGTRLEVFDPEAETVRRIYEMFASGVSVPNIVTTLNADRLAAGEIGNLNSPWNRPRIHRILRGERYVGKVVWNRAKRVTNPTTGRVELHANHPRDVQRVAVPHLRIVTDELWRRVQARLACAGQGSHPLAEA